MTITKNLLDHSIIQYTAWDEKNLYPVGIVWVAFTKTQNDLVVGLLLHAMTIPLARRTGVCTAIFSSIIEDCDIMIGAVGSVEGGKAVMQKFGFILDPKVDMWIYKKGG